jgi:hypothetical protein
MSLRLTRQFRRTGGSIGLVMAMLALVSTFALACMVMPDAGDPVLSAEADALTILCNNALPHHQHDRAPHGGRDCLLCPLCVSAALHAVIVGAAPALPAPVTLGIGQFAALPRARAPPLSVPVTPYPTGPPTLV